LDRDPPGGSHAILPGVGAVPDEAVHPGADPEPGREEGPVIPADGNEIVFKPVIHDHVFIRRVGLDGVDLPGSPVQEDRVEDELPQAVRQECQHVERRVTAAHVGEEDRGGAVEGQLVEGDRHASLLAGDRRRVE
jgi:hypothetical protein